MNPEPQGFECGSSQEADFSWDEYLEENGVLAVPHHTFKHVDLSLRSGLAPGMRLEVCLRSEPGSPYWVATVIASCGQLLLLRYLGHGDDRRNDFWCDVRTSDLHPLGWSRQQGKPMRPPEGVRERHEDWRALLEEAWSQGGSVPAHLLEGSQPGVDPTDLFPPGSCVELQDGQDPRLAWGAEVEENVGGRLHLRYSGMEGRQLPQARCWVFYLDPLLHPQGWAEETGCSLAPPSALRGLCSEEEWEVVREAIRRPQQRAVYGDFFKDRPEPTPHSFSEGMKLEAVHPLTPFMIGPATVVKVLSESHFLVGMDGLDRAGPGGAFLCHRGSAGIFPVQWGLRNGVPLRPPPGYQSEDFDWVDYLKESGALGAPESCFPVQSSDHGIVECMSLEAVNPTSPEHIHVATVTKVKGQHIWLRLEGLKQPLPDLITHVDSLDIFPVNWCENNGHPLQHPPSKPKGHKEVPVAMAEPEKEAPPEATPADGVRLQDLGQLESAQGDGKYSCPSIFFNHRCFPGPYLNKDCIAELPQSVGPGNCVLVLREVLTLLISSAHRPGQALRELQRDAGLRGRGQGETLRAKCRGKSYQATVGVARTADQVAEFCRRTCVCLGCCPNLISPHMVAECRSDHCSLLTKSKCTHHDGERKARPGGLVSPEAKRISKTKKRKPLHTLGKKRSPLSMDGAPAGSPLGSEEGVLDEDYSLSEQDSGSSQPDDSEASRRKLHPLYPTHTSTPAEARSRPQRQHRKACTSFCSDDENQPPAPKRVWVEAQQQERLRLDSSPLGWSVSDVARFIRTTDCAPLARLFKDQEIDGQALLLLSLPTVQECMGLKLGPAIKLCHLIERLKLAFYQHFAN